MSSKFIAAASYHCFPSFCFILLFFNVLYLALLFASLKGTLNPFWDKVTIKINRSINFAAAVYDHPYTFHS